MTVLLQTGSGSINSSAAGVATMATTGALVCLAGLHLLSPEFAPSWRMVSEYANGRHGWLLSLFFALWAIGSWALAAGMWPLASGTMGRVGLVFLVLAGLGEMMAAFFDITHRLHGPAAMIGIPSLSIAAWLLSRTLARQQLTVPSWSVHLPWISVVLMAVAMGLFMSTLARAGVKMSADAPPLAALPVGVIALVGWANRLLVVSYCLWVILAARVVGSARA